MVTIGEVNEGIKNALQYEYENKSPMESHTIGLSDFTLDRDMPDHRRYDPDYIVFEPADSEFDEPLEYFDDKPSTEELSSVDTSTSASELVVEEGTVDNLSSDNTVEVSWRTQSVDISNDPAGLPLIEVIPITDTRYNQMNTDKDSIVGTVTLDEGETFYKDGVQYDDGDRVMYIGDKRLPKRHVGKVTDISEVYTSKYTARIEINVWVPSKQQLEEFGRGFTTEHSGIPEIHEWGDFVWNSLYQYDSKGPGNEFMNHVTLFEVDSGETNDDVESGYEELSPAIRRWRQTVRIGAYRVFEDEQSLIREVKKSVNTSS